VGVPQRIVPRFLHFAARRVEKRREERVGPFWSEWKIWRGCPARREGITQRPQSPQRRKPKTQLVNRTWGTRPALQPARETQTHTQSWPVGHPAGVEEGGGTALRWRDSRNAAMPATIRPYEARDFSAIHKLDQACFVPGISYSKWTLQHFLDLDSADCLIAEEGKQLAGFILAESNPPLAHIITLDIAEAHRRKGVASALLREMEEHFAYHGVQAVLLETAVDNEGAIAFWKRHGYSPQVVLKRYYLGRVDAYEMRKRLEGSG